MNNNKRNFGIKLLNKLLGKKECQIKVWNPKVYKDHVNLPGKIVKKILNKLKNLIFNPTTINKILS